MISPVMTIAFSADILRILKTCRATNNVGRCLPHHHALAPATQRIIVLLKHFRLKYFDTQWLSLWIHRNWYLTRMIGNCLLADCHRWYIVKICHLLELKWLLSHHNQYLQDARQEDISAHFQTFGEIDNINIKTDPATGRSRYSETKVYVYTRSLNLSLVTEGLHLLCSKPFQVYKMLLTNKNIL